MTIYTTRPQRLAAQVREFFEVYRLYRQSQGRAYACRIAWGVAFKGLPF